MSSILSLPGWVKSIAGNFYGGTETLAAAKVIDSDDAMILRLDPGGAGRDVTLPAEESIPAQGQMFLIINAADAAEDLTVKDDAASTIGTVSQNEAAIFVNQGVQDGTASAWELAFIITGAIA